MTDFHISYDLLSTKANCLLINLYHPYCTQAIGDNSDLFGSRTGNLFDRYAASEAAANLVVSAVFNHHRAERLATQTAINATLPSFIEVLRAFSKNVISSHYTAAAPPNRTSDKGGSHYRSSSLPGAASTSRHSGSQEAATRAKIRSHNEIGDFDALKFVPLMHIGNADDNSNSSESTYSTERDNDTEEEGSQYQDRLQSKLTSQDGTAAERIEIDAAAYEQLSDFRLESFIAQSVLINSYLIMLTDVSSSFLVKSQLKVHLKELAIEMQTFLLFLQETKKLLDYEAYSVTEAESFILLDVISHLEMLLYSLSAQKPFLSLLSTPMGPPI